MTRTLPALPAPLETRYSRGDYELQFFQWPGPGAPRMLLVHGIGMGHEVYERFIDEIGPETDLIAVDLPGFCDCPEPEVALSIPATADLLAEALRARQLGPLIAVGHSMGGQVVAELAARHPELVTQVALIAPSVNAAERNLALQALRMLQDFLEGEKLEVLARGSASYFRAGVRWFLKKLMRALDHRLEATLPRVGQPALVMRGTRDRVCPRAWAVRITALLPRGEMRQITGRGHEALISSGEPVARMLLDWATRTGSIR